MVIKGMSHILASITFVQSPLTTRPPDGKVHILSVHIRSIFLLMKHDHNTPEHWMVRQKLESKG
jgi:hypothetical protein